MLLVFFSSFSQKNYWKKLNNKDLEIDNDEVVKYDMTLKEASYFKMDKSDLLSSILEAPYRDESNSSPIELKLPDPNGKFEIYKIFKLKTLAPELAIDYPDIHSFAGSRSDVNDGSLLRITVTPFGFYAMVLKPDVGQMFINPVDKSGKYYMSFFKSNSTDLTQPGCLFENQDNSEAQDLQSFSNQTFAVDDGNLRTYRLAVAATGEYSQFHINQAGISGGSFLQQITAVLSAITVTVDRVNSIYERDLGTTFQLVANNDQIIFLNAANDPYTNSNVFALLSENQLTIDNIIQSANYDIGHVVSTSPGGGLAEKNGLCSSNSKARGATGGGTPVGDAYDIDYVCHEIGHQFGADHTFNNFCGGARNNSTAVEPGSGNTIMAYAGICPPNVQSNSDAHFHQISINQIYQNISAGLGSSCAVLGAQSNSAPLITPVPNYVIPNGTAFYLDVSATDAENDPLTYNWEQINNNIVFPNGQEQPPSPTSTVGPSFRSLPSSTESRRYFPSFADVLAGNLAPTWEVIPTVSRSMNFAVTVRDNNVNVGQSSRDVVSVNFANVGPFQVTSQNTNNINWLPGETRTITWDVAGTTANGINTSNVNILLSTDGGTTFSTTLALGTPNDGSHDIIVPNVQAPICRIMVEAEGNIYYALNSIPFGINTNVTTTCDSFFNDTTVAIPDGNGTTSPSQGTPAFSSITIPDDIQNITDINIKLNATHGEVSDLIFQLQGNSEFTNLWIGNCSGQATIDATFNDNGLTIPAEGFPCGDPITGIYAPASTATSIAEIFAAGTQGTFSIAAVDFFTGNTGTINSWEIEICSTLFSIEDNQFNQFSITPNPNNGVFDLNFSQPLSDGSTISIYDIQGRKVETINPDNSSSVMRVNLESQYHSGVYLIEVTNSNGKYVRKLIIK